MAAAPAIAIHTRRLVGTYVFALGVLLTTSLRCLADNPRLEVNGETLAGIVSEAPGVSAFLGIPFAQAPVGELRWREPLSYVGKGGTRQAHTFASACMQTPRILDWYRQMAEDFGGDGSSFPDLPISEDCLYLNVWMPTASKHAPLPVMVYIHGGSNKSGWSWEPNYHGHALAAKGVVVVSIAYRLGIFGFFSHPQLADAQATANFGVWDQLAALQWIQHNIAAFGGDPARVTVFGESSGAQDIAALMLSTRAKGLLQRAILQSTPRLGLPQRETLAQEQARGETFARAIDSANPPTLSALRAIPAPELLARAETLFPDHYHAPVIDGVLVTAETRELLENAHYPLQQLLIGTNANEWYASTPASPEPDALQAALRDSLVLRSARAESLLKQSADTRTALDRLRTADSMLCPSQYVASQLTHAGTPVWMYQFTRVRNGTAAAALKAYHGAELPYVFGTHDSWLPTDAVDRALGEQIMRYWVKFAATGNPNADGDPLWPAFSAPVYAVQELGNRIRTIATPEPALCALYTEQLQTKDRAERP